jgi:hypothetical protein
VEAKEVRVMWALALRMLNEHKPSAMKAREAAAQFHEDRQRIAEVVELLHRADPWIEFLEQFSAKLAACIEAVEAVPGGIPLFAWENRLMAHHRLMMNALPPVTGAPLVTEDDERSPPGCVERAGRP